MKLTDEKSHQLTDLMLHNKIYWRRRRRKRRRKRRRRRTYGALALSFQYGKALMVRLACGISSIVSKFRNKVTPISRRCRVDRHDEIEHSQMYIWVRLSTLFEVVPRWILPFKHFCEYNYYRTTTYSLLFVRSPEISPTDFLFTLSPNVESQR